MVMLDRKTPIATEVGPESSRRVSVQCNQCLRSRYFKQSRALGGSSLGVSMIEFVIFIPVFLLICGATFDLARLYINSISVREIALLSAKLLNSTSPDGYPFTEQEMQEFYFAPEGEEAEVTDKRIAFWNNQLDDDHETFFGLDYFPKKDRQVLNLSYGLLHKLSPHVYFPIPEPLDDENPSADLDGRTNCSIRIRFAPGSEPPLQTGWPTDPAQRNDIIYESRDRLVNVRCAVPVIGFQIATFGSMKVRYVEAEAYAYKAGSIAP